MDAGSDLVLPVSADAALDLEVVFHAHYARIARVIARVIRDPGRAEELAVEVFLKWSRARRANGPAAGGWLYRSAVRLAIDELRRQTRRSRREQHVDRRRVHTPEEIRAAREEQDRVRGVLAALSRRTAELLILRSDGLSYEELAATLGLRPSSVGTLLSRAQHAFRKEYVRRHGQP